MNLIDQLDEEYAARYRADQRADQYAAALRSRGCPEECIPTFLADREAENRVLRSHLCCSDDCQEIVPRGVLFCGVHQAEIEQRRRKARSRWRRLFSFLLEGM